MENEFRSVSDKVKLLAQSALGIGHEYFANHIVVNQYIMDDAIDDFRFEHRIVAKDENGKQQQQQLSRLFDDIERLCGGIQGGNEIVDLASGCRTFYREMAPWLGFAGSHGGRFDDYARKIIHAAENLVDETPGESLLVADTNALVAAPSFEKWSFPEFVRFTIVLPSTVLSELDSFEHSNKSQAFKAKCRKIVKQIKEYRRRGPLHEGVPIVTGMISLKVIPLDPVFDGTLSWLNPDSNDDKVIARIIALLREHPKCVVVLVTGDLNFQTKADYAGINYMEPPIAHSAPC